MTRGRAGILACLAPAVAMSVLAWGPAAAQPPTAPQVEVAAENPTGRDLDLVLPFRVGPQPLGDLGVRILKDGEILLQQDQLARLAKPSLSPAGVALLESVPSEGGFQSLRRLKEAGLDIFYEPQRLEIILRPNTGQAAAAELSLTRFRQRTSPPTPTVGLSGFLNLFNSLDADDQNDQHALRLGAMRTLTDWALHYGRATLEGEGSFDSERSGVRRSGTRLVVDDLDALVRIQMGDVVSTTTGFQSSEELLGVSLTRSLTNLDLGVSARPTGAQSFRLSRPSHVDVIVNDAFVRRLDLQPGEYTLQDLGFSAGGNNVELLIEDDAGRRDRLNFTLFLSSSLLARGATEFDLTGGIRSSLEDDERVYSGGDGVVSGFVRHGVTDRLTVGMNAQVDAESGLFGSETILGTPMGAFSLSLADSWQKEGNSGYALDLDYTLSRFKLYRGDDAKRNLSMSFEHRSDGFSGLGGRGSGAGYQFAAAYAQELGAGYRAGLSGTWEWGRDDSQDRSNLAATLSGKLKGARVALSLGYAQGDSDFGGGGYALLSLTFDLDSNSRASTSYDSRDHRVQVDYSRTAPDEIGTLNYDLRAASDGDTKSFYESFRYNANRAQLQADDQVTKVTTDDGLSSVRSNHTTLHANTALVFAGGQVALSRPVREGFAIIGLHPTIADKQLVVDPAKGVDLWGAPPSAGPRYQSDFLGPAVVYDLTPYRQRDMAIDVADLPLGYDLGTGAFTVTPYYKAGYGFTVGSNYSVTLIATAVNRDGKPASLLAGTAQEAADSSHALVQVFTNRAGRLVAQGLSPGRWVITLIQPDGSLTYSIDIPKGATGVVRLGTLSPSVGH